MVDFTILPFCSEFDRVLPRQNKMSEKSHESKVEMVISTVLKPVFIGHFILFR